MTSDTPAPAQEAHVEALCMEFHDAYEAAAVATGWETQRRSRKPWADVPEENKETMRMTIRDFLASDWLAAFVAERQAEAWDAGVTAGRATDMAAETQPANPYRIGGASC